MYPRKPTRLSGIYILHRPRLFGRGCWGK